MEVGRLGKEALRIAEKRLRQERCERGWRLKPDVAHHEADCLQGFQGGPTICSIQTLLKFCAYDSIKRLWFYYCP